MIFGDFVEVQAKKMYNCADYEKSERDNNFL